MTRIHGLSALLALQLVTVCFLVGCVTTPRSSQRVIELQPWEESSGSACTVGYELRYPPDIRHHERVINARTGSEVAPGVPEGALSGGGGALPLPRPERDPRVDRSRDDVHVFRVRLMSFNQCESIRYGDRYLATVEIEIGDCASGDCPAVVYRPPEGETSAVFRLAGPAD